MPGEVRHQCILDAQGACLHCGWEPTYLATPQNGERFQCDSCLRMIDWPHDWGEPITVCQRCLLARLDNELIKKRHGHRRVKGHVAKLKDEIAELKDELERRRKLHEAKAR